MAITSSWRSGTSGLSDTTSLTTYTFAAADLGTASADRFCLIPIAHRGASLRTVSSATINGVSAAAVTTQQADDTTGVTFWGAFVPSGATGDIVVTYNAAPLRMATGCWAITGLGSTSTTDRQAGSGAYVASVLSHTADCTAGGALYAIVTSSDGTSLAWTNITERTDVVATTLFGFASDDFASAQTALNVIATKTGGSASQSSGAALLIIALTCNASTAGTVTATFSAAGVGARDLANVASRSRFFMRHAY